MFPNHRNLAHTSGFPGILFVNFFMPTINQSVRILLTFKAHMIPFSQLLTHHMKTFSILNTVWPTIPNHLFFSVFESPNSNSRLVIITEPLYSFKFGKIQKCRFLHPHTSMFSVNTIPSISFTYTLFKLFPFLIFFFQFRMLS